MPDIVPTQGFHTNINQSKNCVQALVNFPPNSFTEEKYTRTIMWR